MVKLTEEWKNKYKISRTWLEVDLKKLEQNILFLEELKNNDYNLAGRISCDELGNKNSYCKLHEKLKCDSTEYLLEKLSLTNRQKEITAVIKADAYGHGAIVISKFLSQNKLVNRFAVASVDEAILLRDSGIDNDIEVLSHSPESRFQDIIDYSLIQIISSYDEAYQLNNLAKSSNRKVKVHLALDSGMGRIGFDIRDFYSKVILNKLNPYDSYSVVFADVEKIVKLKNIEFEAFITHFPNADDFNEDETINSYLDFVSFYYYLKFKTTILATTQEIKLHCSNSAFYLRNNQLTLDYYRPGIVIYGLLPDNCERYKGKLQGISELQAEVTYVKTVPKGHKISYGGTYITENECKIATIACGYADGYSRSLSNIAKVKLENNILVPIAGRVCMDSLMIVLANNINVNSGDCVTLYSLDGEDSEIGEVCEINKINEISVSNLAQLAGTIHYELICAISQRVPRVYFYGEKIVAISKDGCVEYLDE